MMQLFPTADPIRIDWFGEVGYPGVVRRYTQPCIRVAFSPVVNPPDVWTPETEFSVDIDQQRQAWIPIGSLPAVRIGDVWQNGQLLAQPINDIEKFELELNLHQATPIKAGVPIGDNYLLPFAEHPYHARHTQSYCLSVPLDGARTLLIPGVEMIRFYFGSSSKLLHQIFTAPFKEEAFWREKHYNEATGHLHLKLKERMIKASAQDIGRIALCDHAKLAAGAVYGNCVKATSKNEPAYPYIGFPFKGKTKLKVHGIWLSYAGKPKRTFVVFSILSCEHAFPFKSLSYDNPTGEGNPSRKNPNTKKRKGAGGASSAVNGKQELDDADPGKREQRMEIALQRQMRFPDLANKPVWQQQVVLLGAEEIFCRKPDGSVEKVSFGEQVGSGEARAVDFVMENSRPVPAPGNPELPHFVLEGIRKVKMEPDKFGRRLKARPLLVDGRTEPVFPLPMLVDEDGVVDSTPMFTEPDGRQRMRRICFVGFFEDELERDQYVFVEPTAVVERGTLILQVVGKTDVTEILTHICPLN